MSKNPTAFQNKRELISFAQRFTKERIEIFRKDISICLKADAKGRHAYMPALMTCISLLELFSGLYAGKLKYIRLIGILDYSKKFMDSNIYSTDRLSVLYEVFRHKIAHITQPYGVFDTHSVNADHPLQNYPQKFITWKVNATNRHPPIDIVSEKGALTKSPPWPVNFSHRCTVSVYRLKVDLPKSMQGNG
ncbi:unnamed protein product [marine sediment metagenome]|uniref:Uncharacterized protein n=1 Tax=marine sediment metagenome TaxID=412755 RepID=X1DH60_9ZZZZ